MTFDYHDAHTVPGRLGKLVDGAREVLTLGNRDVRVGILAGQLGRDNTATMLASMLAEAVWMLAENRSTKGEAP